MLAWKAHQDGRDDEADAIDRRAVQAYPREKELQFHAGELRFHGFLSTRGSTRDLAEALPFFEASVALDPSDGEAQGHLVPCLLLGRDADAVAAAGSWAKTAPSARAFASLGACRSGRLDEAAAGLQAISDGQYAPDRALATALLGELEAGRGRDAPAIENLERYRTTVARQSGARAAIQLPRTLLLLAQAYERTGDRARARERLDDLLGMWKHADPELALLREAKALRARLNAAPAERASP